MRRSSHPLTAGALLVSCLGPVLLPGSLRAERLEFNRDIRPILADRCFNCHGVDAASRKADLRLDLAESAYAERDGVRAIVPGDPEASELVRRIRTSDPDDQMPPPDHPMQLDQEQKDMLVKWIEQGAEYEGHWAFLPPQRQEVAPRSKDSWARNAIDLFVLEGLVGTGLVPNPEASRRTLIRRLSLDLTGLPPTPQEVEAFVNDSSPDAYEKVVDRLLASERYGERMAMWWLDGARYADSHGFQADWERYQWPWRDWVIEAFNNNMPFDQFTIEQLAGDMLPDATNSQIVATGFNRNHRINTEGGSLDEEWLVENVIDRVETMGSVWLGLTLGCARCHDHKYDPVTQTEFYQLFAFFHNVPEQGKGPGKQGNFEPVINVESTLQKKRIGELDARIAAMEGELRDQEVALVADLKPVPDDEQPGWRVVRNMEITTTGGVEFRRQDDDSFKATGPDPKRDTYTIRIGSGAGTVTGVQLEALPDPEFSNKGFTRSSNGNFVLSSFRAKVVGTGGKVRAIQIAAAEASFEQDGWPIRNTLNREAKSGWAVSGQLHQEPRRGVFRFASPVSLQDGEELELVLDFQAYDHHSIDRFRLSLSDAANPSLGDAAGPSKEVLAALATPHPRRSSSQIKLLQEYLAANPPAELAKPRAELAALRAEREALMKQAPTVMVMKEMEKPRDTYFLNRGQYDSRGEKVEAGLPAAFPPMPEGEPMNRLGLARWIVSGEHPLTARVQVNRLWELLFGTGIVKTSENLGTQADWPSHPELLDWLATELVRLDWDLKAFLKTVVMSATYRQDSAITPEELRVDPENRLLARGPRFRVQAEMVRDQALYLAGLLNEQPGGPSVRPYQPPGIWSEFNFYGNLRNYKHDTGPGLHRRSLYTIWKRTAAPPGMTLFDMPSREICTVKRARTNTPLQALALMNDITYVEASRKFAERMMRDGGSSARDQIAYGFYWATARQPTSEELNVLVAGYERRLAHYEKNPEAVRALLSQGETATDPNLDPVQLAAMTTAASILINLDESITKE